VAIYLRDIDSRSSVQFDAVLNDGTRLRVYFHDNALTQTQRIESSGARVYDYLVARILRRGWLLVVHVSLVDSGLPIRHRDTGPDTKRHDLYDPVYDCPCHIPYDLVGCSEPGPKLRYFLAT
jgi:hypothetical protein